MGYWLSAVGLVSNFPNLPNFPGTRIATDRLTDLPSDR
jgi:hypothetical protein